MSATPSSSRTGAGAGSVVRHSSSTVGGGRELQLAPPPERSLRGQEVLSEDEYTSALSRIIKRDFFPNLARLDAENAYLTALESQDPVQIEASVRALVREEERAGIVAPTPRASRTPRASWTPRPGGNGAGAGAGGAAAARTPGSTPYSRTEDTPMGMGRGREWDPTPGASTSYSVQTAQDEPVSHPAIEKGLSLDEFQSRFTSEDNASFGQILQKANEKRREAFKWAYEAEERANRSRRKAIEGGKTSAENGRRLAIAAKEEEAQRTIEQKQMLLIEDGKGKGKGKRGENDAGEEEADGKMPAPDPNKDDPNFDPNAVLREKKDERRAAFDMWGFTTRNSLMYPPDANITTTNRRTSSLPTASSSQTAADKTRGIVEPPAILHANTRVWEGQDAGADAPDSPRSSRIEAAIKGWGYGSDASSDAGLSLFGAGLNAEPSTPRVAGFGFVSAMPSPTPRQLGEDRVRQLMTWGTVEGTPRAVREGGGDETPLHGADTPFAIPPSPRREQLARKLSSSASRSLRSSSQSSHSHASPRALPTSYGYGTARYTPGHGVGASPFGGALKGSARTSSSSAERLRKDPAALSPAAKSLLDRTSSLSRLKTEGFGMAAASGAGRKRSALGRSILHRAAGAGGKTRQETEAALMEREQRTRERLAKERWTPTPSPVVQRGLGDVAGEDPREVDVERQGEGQGEGKGERKKRKVSTTPA